MPAPPRPKPGSSTTAPDDGRRLLGAFLRSHRERLTPAEAGIAGGPARRRTPGLRREEVALLCGLSPTWYTWLEQGRGISLSPQALARVAGALRLTPAERAYLFELTGRRDPDGPVPGAEPPPPVLLAALRAMTVPAYLLDRFWNARGWNAPAGRLFAGWLGPTEKEGAEEAGFEPASGEPNLLRYVFLDPGARILIPGWEGRARRLLAEFRADTAGRSAAPEFRALVRGLREASPAFARFWEDHGVLEREGGPRAFRHPEEGGRLYEQVTLTPAAAGGHKLVMLIG
ncbi:helix-turn-helix transcriptional regulator [Azospirillum sp. SYSU D00513]|uniref:helix-turn-helix transcriptional regulator n=1 Tax=Azospirillum sp. SYSU D00513 TaxID=2812561 RepID=UPI001A95F5C5|nr:helix-turn-helix transcriptional regulator [Azospirillum sp. SYSU D00513]